MASKNEIRENAKQIVAALGVSENIISAAHCATRLRLVLKDESIVNMKDLESISLYKGQFSNGGQFQIILGSGIVDEVYKEFIKITGLAESTKSEVKAQADEKLNPLQKMIKTLADVFVPILPAIVASGLLMGLNNVLSSQGLFVEGKSLMDLYPQMGDLANFINTMANAAYSFLPILLGFSATKLFGGNPYLGAVVGMIMVHPDLLNGYGYGDGDGDKEVP